MDEGHSRVCSSPLNESKSDASEIRSLCKEVIEEDGSEMEAIIICFEKQSKVNSSCNNIYRAYQFLKVP